jgi:hypothetical protein
MLAVYRQEWTVTYISGMVNIGGRRLIRWNRCDYWEEVMGEKFSVVTFGHENLIITGYSHLPASQA